MVGKRRARFGTNEEDQPPTGRSATSRGRGISSRDGTFLPLEDGAVRRGKRGFQRSRGRGGVPAGVGSGSRGQGRQDSISDPPRRRTPQRPTNPHDPKSKDPFMRAGLSMGTNKTKIFKRAGMSMGG